MPSAPRSRTATPALLLLLSLLWIGLVPQASLAALMGRAHAGDSPYAAGAAAPQRIAGPPGFQSRTPQPPRR